MSTMTLDDLPNCMAQRLLENSADLDDETLCTFLLASDPALLMREIAQHMDEAIAIAAEHCEQELAKMWREVEEMRL